MATADLQAWYYIAIPFRDKVTGSANTRNFSNRPILEGSTRYYPLLKNVSNVGSALSGNTPAKFVGVITLDNSPSSFEYERKISDLLERYTIVDEEVKVYYAETALDDNDPTADFAQVVKGKIAGYKLNITTQELSIKFNAQNIPTGNVNFVITPTTIPDAPDAAYGKALPIVFGEDIQVRPVRVSDQVIYDTTSCAIDYVYATELGDDFEYETINKWLAMDSDGRFVEVQRDFTFSNPVISYGTGGSSLALSGATEGVLLDDYTSTYNYILTGGYMYFVAQNDATFDIEGNLIFSIWEIGKKDSSSGTVQEPIKQIAVGRVDKAKYGSAMRSTGYVLIKFMFDAPAVLAADKSYMFAQGETFEDYTDRNDIWPIDTDNSATTKGWETNEARGGVFGAEPGWKYYSAYSRKWRFGLYAMALQYNNYPTTPDHSDSNTHLTARMVRTKFYNYYQEELPGFYSGNYIFEIDGLTDDSSGTITGTPWQQIVRPDHAIATILTEWDGSNWSPASFDSSKFSATHTNAFSSTSNEYYRRIDGRTTGNNTRARLIAEICANSACLLTGVNSTSSDKYLGLYAWGDEISTSKVLTDDDIEIVEADQAGTDTIVNSIRMFYKNLLTSVDLLNVTATGSFTNYASSIELSNSGDDQYVEEITEQSTTLYGQRELATSGYNWLVDDDSARVVALRYLTEYALPHIYVLFEGPISKLYDLEMFDVVELLHTELPAFFGTSSAASLPTYNGAPVDILSGHHWRRAQRYRAQVIARYASLAGNKPQTMRVLTRILNNPYDPT